MLLLVLPISCKREELSMLSKAWSTHWNTKGSRWQRGSLCQKQFISSFHLYHLSLCHVCVLCSILQLSVVLWFSFVGFNAHPNGLLFMFCWIQCSSQWLVVHVLLDSMLIPMACCSCFVVITLFTVVVQVLCLTQKSCFFQKIYILLWKIHTFLKQLLRFSRKEIQIIELYDVFLYFEESIHREYNICIFVQLIAAWRTWQVIS